MIPVSLKQATYINQEILKLLPVLPLGFTHSVVHQDTLVEEKLLIGIGPKPAHSLAILDCFTHLLSQKSIFIRFKGHDLTVLVGASVAALQVLPFSFMRKNMLHFHIILAQEVIKIFQISE